MADPRVDVTIGANVAQFAGAMQAVTGQLRGFLSLAAFTALAKSAIDLGGALTDMSNKTQVSVKWLQEVGYAASQTGSSIEDLANAIVELRRSQAQALRGSQSDTNAFAVLGVSIGELRTLNAEEIFDRIAESVRRSGGAIQEVNAAISVLGRGGKNILPAMVSGMAELRAEARDLGLVLDESAVAAMDNLGDTIDRVLLKLKVFTAQLVQMVQYGDFWKTVLNVAKVPTQGILQAFREASWGDMEGLRNAWQTLKQTINGTYAKTIVEGSPRPWEVSGNEGVNMDLSGADAVRPGGRSKRSAETADTLQRIGGYISGAGSQSRLLSIQNSALQELREMRRTLTSMSRRKLTQDLDL